MTRDFSMVTFPAWDRHNRSGSQGALRWQPTCQCQPFYSRHSAVVTHYLATMPKAARYRTFDIVPSDPVRWSWIEVDGKVVTTQNMEGPSIAPQNPAHDSSLEDNEPGDSMDIDYTEESDEDGDDMSIASCAVEEEEPRPEVLDDAEAGPHVSAEALMYIWSLTVSRRRNS